MNEEILSNKEKKEISEVIWKDTIRRSKEEIISKVYSEIYYLLEKNEVNLTKKQKKELRELFIDKLTNLLKELSTSK